MSVTVATGPCANCHHLAAHSAIVGCLAEDCDCETYARPQAETPVQEGQRLGQEGGDAALHSYAVEATDWRARAQERLDQLLKDGVEFTANDVTAVAGVAPSPSAIGGLFKANKKRMTFVRWDDQNGRPVAHGRPLRVWKSL